MKPDKPILLVEDNEDDALLMKRAMKAAGISNRLSCVEDGQEAIDYLGGSGKFSDRLSYPIPAFVFLDLKLPLKSGLEVLAWKRNQAALEGVVVLVLTSSSEASDLREAYKLGVNSYVVKPAATSELAEFAKAFRTYWMDFNRIPPA